MFPFKPDQKITDFLRLGQFTVSAEIIPPRNGTELSLLLAQIQDLISAGAQFLAVTKGAGGSLRGGSLPIAQTIKEKFNVPCIAHFTCRDLTIPEIENQLMDHHYFGIRNILALRGDPPTGQPDWKPREGGYSYAYELIEQIVQLNQGVFQERAGFSTFTPEKTDFCIGAAAYPEHPRERERIEFFEQKARAGAQYAITNLLFDPETYARFRDECASRNVEIPILPGTRILRSQKQAHRMVERFQVKIPDWFLKRLPETLSPESPHAGLSAGLELFYELTERLKRLGAPGMHCFVITDTDAVCQGLQNLAQRGNVRS